MLKFAQISPENVTFLDKCQHEFGDFDSAIEMNSGKQPPGTHCHHFTSMSDISSTLLRLTFWILPADVKGPPTMGSRQTESGARRRASAPTAHRSSPSPRCPMTAPTPPPWLSCPTIPAWSTPPSTPAWRTTTASRAAPPAWPLAAAARRVSVSAQMDVCVC